MKNMLQEDMIVFFATIQTFYFAATKNSCFKIFSFKTKSKAQVYENSVYKNLSSLEKNLFTIDTYFFSNGLENKKSYLFKNTVPDLCIINRVYILYHL